jgi:hypothetical protein
MFALSRQEDVMIASRFVLVALAFIAAGGAPALASVPSPACARPPTVDAGALGDREQAADLTLRNFDTAYRHACLKGLMRDHPLIEPGSVSPGRLFLKNAPEANIASIYRDSGENERPGRMVLEYPFVTTDGQVHVPGADELEEAIFCAVHGATSEEDEGRCLPD